MDFDVFFCNGKKNASCCVRLTIMKISNQYTDDIVAFLRLKTCTIFPWLNAKLLHDMHSKGSEKENFSLHHTPDKSPTVDFCAPFCVFASTNRFTLIRPIFWLILVPARRFWFAQETLCEGKLIKGCQENRFPSTG